MPSPAEIVRRTLHDYAARGSFASFSEVPARAPKIEFRFRWFRDVPFRIVFNPSLSTLTFVDVLPGVASRSVMDRELRRFIRGRSAQSVVAHRRLDERRVGIKVLNQHGTIRLTFQLKAGHQEYGVRRAVNLVHEIIMDFLNDSRFVQYQVDHLRLDPELAS